MLVSLLLCTTFYGVQVRAQTFQPSTSWPILVIEGEGYNKGKIVAYLTEGGSWFDGMHLDTIIDVVNTEDDLKRLWPSRNDYGIMIIGYHTLRDNEFLQTWLYEHEEEIFDWVASHGGWILATIKDPEDVPLSEIFDLRQVELETEVNDLPLLPDTPLSDWYVEVPDMTLHSVYGFCKYGFEWDPGCWVEESGFVIAELEGVPVMVAGKVGAGGVILSGAEWVDVAAEDTPTWAPGLDGWDAFWTNVFSFIEDWGEFVPPELPSLPLLLFEGEGKEGSLVGPLIDMGYPGRWEEVVTNEDLQEWWPRRNEFRIIIIQYHSIRDNEFFQTWISEHGDEIKAWVQEGGCLVATIKDAEDLPLGELFGLTQEDFGEEVSQVDLVEDTPFAADVPDLKIGADTFCRYGFAEPLPDWVEYIVATHPKTGGAAIVAGRCGNGSLILGGAEFVTEVEGYSVGAGGYYEFWRNLFNWVKNPSAFKPPAPEYYEKKDIDKMLKNINDRIESLEEEIQKIQEAMTISPVDIFLLSLVLLIVAYIWVTRP